MKFDLSNLRIPKLVREYYRCPDPKTKADRANPFFPNVVRGGDNMVGLMENTFQVNRGVLWEENTIKIEDALSLLRIYVEGDRVQLVIPKIESQMCIYNSEKVYTVELKDTYTIKEGLFPSLGIRARFYLDKKPKPEPQCAVDQWNSDFSYYSGIRVTPFRQRRKLYALVSLYKVNYEWCDKSSFGVYICHEFVSPLEADGDGYKLGKKRYNPHA